MRVGARHEGEPMIPAHSPLFDVGRGRNLRGRGSARRVRAPRISGARRKQRMTAPVVADTARPDTLRRSLGFTDLALLAGGTVIGSGIYLAPSVVLRQSGMNPRLAVLIWVVGGVLSLLGALTYAELGAMQPDAGGLYVYIRDAFGPLAAFLYGWTSFFVIASGSIAALAVAFGNYLSQIVPIDPTGNKLIAIGLIVVTAVINVVGTSKSSAVQNWTTAVKVIALLGLSLAMIALGHHGDPTSAASTSNPGDTTVRLSAAMIGVLWAYEGWQYVTFSAGEAKDPQRYLSPARSRRPRWGRSLFMCWRMSATSSRSARRPPAARITSRSMPSASSRGRQPGRSSAR